MKKIIAMLLVLSMVLSFAACGKKAEEPAMTVPVPTAPAVVETEPPVEETEPIVEETEPVVEEPVTPEIPAIELPQAQLPADEAVVADKQAKYEKVFTEGEYVMDTNAIRTNYANVFSMDMVSDDEGKSMMRMSGSMEGVQMDLMLYVVSDTEGYYHRAGVEEGVTMDEWYKLSDLVNEDGERVTGTMTTSTDNISAFTEGLQSVTYLGEYNGYDVVAIEYVPVEEEDEEDADWEVIADADYEFEFNGQRGELRSTAQKSKENGGVSRSTSWTEEPEGFDGFDWRFDEETLSLTNKETGEVLACTMVTDHMTETPEEVAPSVATIVVNPEDNKIMAVYMTQMDAVIYADLTPCEDLAAEIELPTEFADTISAEEAAMEIAMSMFAFMFALAGMAE